MLLQQVSRTVYLQAKDNLVRPIDILTPVESRARLQQLTDPDLERERGRLAQRQFSLLRTQLKSDLAIFGQPYGPKLGLEDRAFLIQCDVDISHKPWSDATAADEGE